MNKEKKNSVLVTGAGSGIGKSCTEFLCQKGFIVYATDKDERSLEQFQENSNITAIKMDVTSEKDIQDAAKFIKENGSDLYALVNNAGVIKLGPLVEAPFEEIYDHINVNCLGPVRVTREFYPLLRESKGRIINISSLVALSDMPFYGPYTMSKKAIESFSETLRRELATSGVKVITLRLGGVQTAIWDKAIPVLDGAADEYPDSPFKPKMEALLEYLGIGKTSENGNKGAKSQVISPLTVSKAVYRAITANKPKRMYVVAKRSQKLQIKFMTMLPMRLLDSIIAKLFQNKILTCVADFLSGNLYTVSSVI
ncbi:MAG: SDR family NAD(P)-dependent oxidoreductase [Candidatus Odinarchaeota archaeon]